MIVALFLLLPAFISCDSEMCDRARECDSMVYGIPMGDFPFASCNQETKATFRQVKACLMEVADGDLYTAGAGCSDVPFHIPKLPMFYGKIMKRAIQYADNVLCKGCSWLQVWLNCTAVGNSERSGMEACDVLREIEIGNTIVNCAARALYNDETCKPLRKDLLNLFHVVRVLYVVDTVMSCSQLSKGPEATEKRSIPKTFKAYEDLLTMFK